MEFEKYRSKLDGLLKIGRLAPVFKIFNRYRQRVYERLVFQINWLENGLKNMDFNSEESIIGNLKQHYSIKSTPAVMINNEVFIGKIFKGIWKVITFIRLALANLLFIAAIAFLYFSFSQMTF